ncbi:hypothetical protein JTB14_033509, partial [Gonioctena quinquepunctata]
ITVLRSDEFVSSEYKIDLASENLNDKKYSIFLLGTLASKQSSLYCSQLAAALKSMKAKIHQMVHLFVLLLIGYFDITLSSMSTSPIFSL